MNLSVLKLKRSKHINDLANESSFTLLKGIVKLSLVLDTIDYLDKFTDYILEEGISEKDKLFFINALIAIMKNIHNTIKSKQVKDYNFNTLLDDVFSSTFNESYQNFHKRLVKIENEGKLKKYPVFYMMSNEELCKLFLTLCLYKELENEYINALKSPLYK